MKLVKKLFRISIVITTLLTGIVHLNHAAAAGSVASGASGKIQGLGSLKPDQIGYVPKKFQYFYEHTFFTIQDFYGPNNTIALNAIFTTAIPNARKSSKTYGVLYEPGKGMDILQLSMRNPRNGALEFDLKNSLDICRLSSKNNVFGKDLLSYNTADGEANYAHICSEQGRQSFDIRRGSDMPVNNSYILTISNNGMWAVVQGDLDADGIPKLYIYDVANGSIIDLDFTNDMLAFIPTVISDNGKKLYGFSINSDEKTSAVICSLKFEGEAPAIKVTQNFRTIIHPDDGFYGISALSGDYQVALGTDHSVSSYALRTTMAEDVPVSYTAFHNHPQACVVKGGNVRRPRFLHIQEVGESDSMGLDVSRDGVLGVGSAGEVVIWMAALQGKLNLGKGTNMVATVWRNDVDGSIQIPLKEIYKAQALIKAKEQKKIDKEKLAKLSPESSQKLMDSLCSEINSWRLLTAEKCHVDENGDYWIAGLGVYYPSGRVADNSPGRFEPYMLRLEKAILDKIIWTA